jgi:hypothetical protein
MTKADISRLMATEMRLRIIERKAKKERIRKERDRI